MVKILLFLFFSFSIACGAVNINRANAAQLETLYGIGPSKAKEIVAYRKSHGPFRTVGEIVNVKGIGPKTLEKMRSQITVN